MKAAEKKRPLLSETVVDKGKDSPSEQTTPSSYASEQKKKRPKTE